MIYGIFGSYGRTGTYWLRDLLVSQGIQRAPKNDYPDLSANDMLDLAAMGNDVVFRTARPYRMTVMATQPNTSVIITMRDPRDILCSFTQAFDRNPEETARFMEDAFTVICEQTQTLCKRDVPYMTVWYETVREQWPDISHFICGLPDEPFPVLPIRGATMARVPGQPIDFEQTVDSVESMTGKWRDFDMCVNEILERRCPRLMHHFYERDSFTERNY